MSFPRVLPVAALGLALVTCGDADARQPELFPLADGNRWTLRDLDSGAATVISVRGRQGALLLHGFPGTGVLSVRRVRGAIQAWDRADRRWERFLRLDARAGTRYLVDLRETGLWQSVVVLVASKRAVVRDFRGRARRGCTRLVFRYRSPIADAGLVEFAFAPGIGPIRYSETTIAGERAGALAGFRIRHPRRR